MTEESCYLTILHLELFISNQTLKHNRMIRNKLQFNGCYLEDHNNLYYPHMGIVKKCHYKPIFNDKCLLYRRDTLKALCIITILKNQLDPPGLPSLL